MRTVRLDLDLNGTRLRVVCEDPEAGEVLRRALQKHIVDEPAEIGFVLREVPPGSSDLALLIDRSGMVLGRTRHPIDLLPVLAGHLAIFLPAPSDTTRLRLRAFVNSRNEAVLAAFPLLTTPAPVERVLERRHGCRIIDRMAVDVTDDLRLAATPPPWPELVASPNLSGHVQTPEDVITVSRVAIPRGSDVPASIAEGVALVTTLVVSDNRTHAIETAERLITNGIVSSKYDERSVAYDILS